MIDELLWYYVVYLAEGMEDEIQSALRVFEESMSGILLKEFCKLRAQLGHAVNLSLSRKSEVAWRLSLHHKDPG